MARKPIEWTEEDCETFRKLCSRFNSEADICDIMGVTDKTLVNLINKYLKDEITPGSRARLTFADAREHYAAEGRASLRKQLFEMAMSGNERAMILLAENELGYSRKKAVQKETTETRIEKKKKEATDIDKLSDRASKLPMPAKV